MSKAVGIILFLPLGFFLSHLVESAMSGNEEGALVAGVAVVVIIVIEVLIYMVITRGNGSADPEGEGDLDDDEYRKIQQRVSVIESFAHNHGWFGGSSGPEPTTVILSEEENTTK